MEFNLDFYQVVRPDIKDLSISVVSKTETKEHVIKFNSENTEDGEECGIEVVCDSNKDLRNALLKISNLCSLLANQIQSKAQIEVGLDGECNSWIPEVNLTEITLMADSELNKPIKNY